MKLWLAERDGRKVDYDQYDSWVVAAETEEEAITLTGYSLEPGYKIRVIGESLPDQVTGIVLGSFNAG